jgi:hypothetical protein
MNLYIHVHVYIGSAFQGTLINYTKSLELWPFKQILASYGIGEDGFFLHFQVPKTYNILIYVLMFPSIIYLTYSYSETEKDNDIYLCVLNNNKVNIGGGVADKMHTETIVFLSQRPIRWIYNVNSREPDHL